MLSAQDLRSLNFAKHMPSYCLDEVTSAIRAALQGGQLDTIQAMALDHNVTKLQDCIGANERLLKTPVPFGFILHLRTILLLYCVCLPLYIHSWIGLPVTLAAAYMLLGLEQLSREVDMPFRRSWHSLPLDDICTSIKNNCLETKARRVGGALAAAAEGGVELELQASDDDNRLTQTLVEAYRAGGPVCKLDV
jgi:putative membrane protein